jgi:hypothetical protein
MDRFIGFHPALSRLEYRRMIGAGCYAAGTASKLADNWLFAGCYSITASTTAKD